MRRTPNEEAARWLEQAREDLRWAAHLAEEGGHYLACFLAQQVAEKALKAFLYAQGEEIVLGHSVALLGEKAGAYAPGLRGKVSAWAILDGFYIPTRYPNGLPDGIPARVYNEKAAHEAVELAREVVETVEELIGLG
ncbi:MAG: HEPN domain-containing protein [Bacillota bacterium]